MYYNTRALSSSRILFPSRLSFAGSRPACSYSRYHPDMVCIPDASFSSYLYTIVRNRILNQLRDLVNQDKLKEQILQQAVDYSNDTQNEILANDLKQLISCAMQQLTPRQRKIFEMSREQQMSHKEIADVLGISVNTVQESISTSLRTLRFYLKKNFMVGTDLILLFVCLGL